MLLLEFQAFLINGLVNTLLLSLAMIIGGTLFAIIFAAGLSVRSTLLSRSAYLLVECLRDIPLTSFGPGSLRFQKDNGNPHRLSVCGAGKVLFSSSCRKRCR